MNELLKDIDQVEDLRNLKLEQLPQLAKELREFIINIVATKEGHLGASLGVVELTIALHYVFNTPQDKLIWDVGHQAYGHKILTGRKDLFETNRQFGGISGFPKRSESEFDVFGTGHSSTSISAALGMAIASKLKGDNNTQHIAVIGDASIASGMAFEGLNHAGVTDVNLMVIVNDNAIGIDPSVGALKNYLTSVKTGNTNQDNIFEALNFNYSGPVDGHNIEQLIQELNRLKSIKGPKILHVVTIKGKGLKKAEENQIKYHAPGKFDAKTGELATKQSLEEPPKFQDVFGISLLELADKNNRIVAITPAMPTGSSVNFMIEKYPDRAFDVGIAEQHAVTLSAGLATQGMVVFCVIYSTFLQRAYDQLIHDVAIQNLPVIFCIDRAGLVGEDGATHHGVFDIAYLRCIPNLILAAPRNEMELRNLMYSCQLGISSPIAIRYPRGRGNTINWQQPFQKLTIGEGKVLREGDDLVVLSVGFIADQVKTAIEILDLNAKIGHIDMRFIKPLDEKLLDKVFNTDAKLLTVEDGSAIGGFGSAILEYANKKGYTNKIKVLGIQDIFIEHGTTEELRRIARIDSKAIAKAIKDLLL